MKLTDSEIEVLIKQVLTIGEEMYCSGAEIGRIEDSLYRMGKVYGAREVHIFAITSSIVVTMEFDDHAPVTQSRRINRRESMDLAKLELLNQLCRDCVAKTMSVEELTEQVELIRKEGPKWQIVFLGEVIAAVGFAVFFGGNGWDAILAAVAACVIFAAQTYVLPLFQSRMFFNTFVSFLVGTTVCLGCRIFPMLHADQIMIGDIMVLIPGIAITNSIRYTLRGDSISGVEKLIDSVLQACAIAAGFTLAIYFFR